jgi:O-antigen ligase
MTYAEAIGKVLLVGLLLGAGLPAVFAGGMVAYSSGAGGEQADGTVHAPNPALKYLGILIFLFVGWVIITAIAWITRGTIIHHFGFDPFPMLAK